MLHIYNAEKQFKSDFWTESVDHIILSLEVIILYHF